MQAYGGINTCLGKQYQAWCWILNIGQVPFLHFYGPGWNRGQKSEKKKEANIKPCWGNKSGQWRSYYMAIKRTFSYRTNVRNPKRARWAPLACSSIQSELRIHFILPTRPLVNSLHLAHSWILCHWLLSLFYFKMGRYWPSPFYNFTRHKNIKIFELHTHKKKLK